MPCVVLGRPWTLPVEVNEERKAEMLLLRPQEIQHPEHVPDEPKPGGREENGRREYH